MTVRSHEEELDPVEWWNVEGCRERFAGAAAEIFLFWGGHELGFEEFVLQF